jgi:hypothetical protein
VLFHFHDENEPAATTGVEGNVTDILLPSVGDVVRHRDSDGKFVLGRVTERVYMYDLPDGDNVQGSVIVTLTLRKLHLQ